MISSRKKRLSLLFAVSAQALSWGCSAQPKVEIPQTQENRNGQDQCLGELSEKGEAALLPAFSILAQRVLEKAQKCGSNSTEVENWLLKQERIQ